MAQLHEKMLHAADGTPLYVADWLIKNRPVQHGAHGAHGCVVIMHGLGEHCGRYLHVVKFFTDCGLSVRTYDQRGHGKSGGSRGDIPNGEPLLQDAQIVIDDFAAETGSTPILLGHSMGGLFAARFALEARAPLRALILSSPALAVDLAGWQKILLKVMRRLAPGLGLPNNLPLQYLSHDPAIAKAYKADHLVHSRISARLMLRILAAIEYCQAHAAKLKIPCYMLVAGSDKLVNPQGSRQFFPQLPKKLATLKIYPDLYHELFNEVQAEQVFADLRDWLLRQNLVREQDMVE